MRFLLTNDDGVAAPGIWAAARVLVCLGQVTVVAPATNYSGYGAGTMRHRDCNCRLSELGVRYPDYRQHSRRTNQKEVMGSWLRVMTAIIPAAKARR